MSRIRQAFRWPKDLMAQAALRLARWKGQRSEIALRLADGRALADDLEALAKIALGVQSLTQPSHTRGPGRTA